ncbi:MAG: hypothetical protein WCS99_12310 [Limisphaerales bacterium]
MSNIPQTICLLFGILTVAIGCTSPIHAKTRQRYYEAGEAEERSGDLALARQYYYRSFVNAQLGHLGPGAEAYSVYEWTRVSGYLGKREDAEGGFPRVLELIKQAKGQADQLKAPALCEFARYLHDTGQHERAVPVYRDALVALDTTGVEKLDPVGFAVFLAENAESLKRAGFPTDADVLLNRSNALKSAHPGVSPKQAIRRYPN